MNLLPTITSTSLKTWRELRHITLFTSPSAESVSEPYIRHLPINKTVYVDTADLATVQKLVSGMEQPEVIYAVGGGRVCDVARFAANHWNVEVFCIPTAISSDAFLVDCTGLRENGCVRYIPTRMATEVILDWDLLLKIPMENHLAGCGDVLSIFTGLHDWRVTTEQGDSQADEIYDPSVATIAQGILDGLLAAAPELRKGSRQGVQNIITSLAMEVALCNFYGNSRPEEGGEHYFAYCIERKLPHFMHGHMVSFGVLLTACLQGQDWQRIRSFLDNIGLQYKPQGLTADIVRQTLRELPDYVVKHKLRRSVYNDFDYEAARNTVSQFLESLEIA